MQQLKPMEAVAVLYGGGRDELAGNVVASLSRAVFSGGGIRTAGRIKRAVSRVFYRILQCTTSSCQRVDERGSMMTVYRNPIMERSRHPYAFELLGSSRHDTSALVEGGDPMNGPYMMIAPEIRGNGTVWDRLFLDSVQGRDVQSRFVWETRATYELARRALEKKESVRMKAIAAGTGLSMILAYDRLLHDGYDPDLIRVKITDREPANVEKTNRLLHKLATTKGRQPSTEFGSGIYAEAEDIFPADHAGLPDKSQYDLLTAIGILEYFPGESHGTTEQVLRLRPDAGLITAQALISRITEMTTERAKLIVNTYRADASVRILELFGRRFDYRHRKHLESLLAPANFRPLHLAGSGNIYDVEVYERNPAAGKDVVLVTPGGA